MVPLTARTQALVDAIFAEPERERAAALLRERCARNLPWLEHATPQSLDRIRFAALKVSGGDLELLQRAVVLAQTDWRDLLVAAGFADDAEAHLGWAPGAASRS